LPATPEEVALELLSYVAASENVQLAGVPSPAESNLQRASRSWILDSYAECLATVRGERRPRPEI
jgi:hypothetical protein